MRPTPEQEALAEDIVAQQRDMDVDAGCTCTVKSLVEFDIEGNPSLIQLTHSEDCELELDTDISCSWN